jgi:putative transposase
MARLPRLTVAGQPLHIIHRGNNRQAIFFAEADYQRILSDLAMSAKKYKCHVHAYVLMTNHIHLLLTPIKATSASRMMQSVGRRYVRYINSEYRRSGTLWEGRFKSGLIDSERYLLSCYRYIEMNPVRAVMCESPSDYRWSSYHYNALGQPDKLVDPHQEYLLLGKETTERRRTYLSLFENSLDEEVIKAIREGTEKGEVVGTERFQEEIAKMIKRPIKKLAHGGDRKSEIFKDNR